MVLQFLDSFKFKGGAKECSNYRALLNQTVNYLNELLHARGYVTIRDLYEQLGRENVFDSDDSMYGWEVQDGPIELKLLHDGKFKLHYRFEAKPLTCMLRYSKGEYEND